jgi:hypothetical protein
MNSERERQISQAKKDIRSIQHDFGKQHTRLHDERLDDYSNKLRALNHDVCANCQFLIIDRFYRGTRNHVALRCAAGLSPLRLYQDTEPLEKAECDKYSPLDQDPESKT